MKLTIVDMFGSFEGYSKEKQPGLITEYLAGNSAHQSLNVRKSRSRKEERVYVYP
jgi:hypothetical protein